MLNVYLHATRILNDPIALHALYLPSKYSLLTTRSYTLSLLYGRRIVLKIKKYVTGSEGKKVGSQASSCQCHGQEKRYSPRSFASFVSRSSFLQYRDSPSRARFSSLFLFSPLFLASLHRLSHLVLLARQPMFA